MGLRVKDLMASEVDTDLGNNVYDLDCLCNNALLASLCFPELIPTGTAPIIIHWHAELGWQAKHIDKVE